MILTEYLKNIGYNIFVLSVALFLGCASTSRIKTPLVPDESHSDDDYYWVQGKPILTSILANTTVAFSADRKGSGEVELTLYIRNSSSSKFDIQESDIRAVAILSSSYDVSSKTSCLATEDLPFVERMKKPETEALRVPVVAARDYMQSIERKQRRSNLLSAVGSAMAAARYKSETAQAITIESGVNRMERNKERQNNLIDELDEGLLQRHTLFPERSYSGAVRFNAHESLFYMSGETIRTSPGGPSVKKKVTIPVDSYQVCVNAGPDLHTFLIKDME
jgi:hypothetical protein